MPMLKPLPPDYRHLERKPVFFGHDWPKTID
jgi:hypothetical protein